MSTITQFTSLHDAVEYGNDRVLIDRVELGVLLRVATDALRLLQEHQDAHGTAEKQRPAHFAEYLQSQADLDADKWRVRRDHLLKAMKPQNQTEV